MNFFKNRNSKRSDFFVLLCGFIALVFIGINFFVGDQLFDYDLALAEILLVIIYFFTIDWINAIDDSAIRGNMIQRT
jgi:hypothetical protein